MLELLAAGMTVTQIADAAGVTRGVARYLKRTGGQAIRPGRSPFFTEEEEELLFQFLRVRALIGRGLTRDAFLVHCQEYILSLSSGRQDDAKRYFGGTTKPGRAFFRLFMRRWPRLKQYRVGMLEQARAENSRPEVLAKWYAGLDLCYRDLGIKQGRQLFNMDETHVRSRDLLTGGRTSIVATDDIDKPEVVAPSIGSAASGCTAAFTVSPGGVAAPYFCVVDGAASGHAYVSVAENGHSRFVPLAARLNEGAMVTRRRPPGFDKDIFDMYAAHFSAFAAGYFPQENKLLSVDGAKVHLSAPGLLTLLKAKVSVIAEPSKLSHLIQALDTPTLFGRFQPASRRCIRERASDCVEAGRRFNVLDLMDCISKAAGDTFTPTNLASAFRRVGMWPLDPTRVPVGALSKGAARPVVDVDLAFLKARLIPVLRKELTVPVVANGTLSTAGRPVVLTAPEVLGALQSLDEEKKRKAAAQQATRQRRAKRSTELQAQREAKKAAAEKATARAAWLTMCGEGVEVARSWQLAPPSSRKRASRRRAAQQRRRVQAPGRPLPTREAWRIASLEAAAVGLQRMWRLRGSVANSSGWRHSDEGWGATDAVR